ncbi:MAG: PIN domain-containing protein [Anaerolineae bacterium]
MTAPRAHVDANVVLRYLVGEPAPLATRAASLFARAENHECTLVLEAITVAEVVWTLKSFCRKRPSEIAPVLRQLLTLPGVEVPERPCLLSALMHYELERVDFGDALLAARVDEEGTGQVYSFDRHFDRLPGIRRLEP